MFIRLLKNITVIKVSFLWYIFVCYPYYPTFRLSDLDPSQFRSDNRGYTVFLLSSFAQRANRYLSHTANHSTDVKQQSVMGQLPEWQILNGIIIKHRDALQ